jgi:predicted dehydrogenase
MLRFNLERLNHLEFADAREPATDQGTKDILVTDMQHPVFPHFWRPAHIVGYEHTFIAALGEFLEALAADREFHPDFRDGLAVQKILSALQASAGSGQWTAIAN